MELKEYTEENKPKKIDEIRNVIKAWKILHDLPIEGEESKNWDIVHYPRFAKSAKSLILLFGYEDAVDCLEFMTNHYKQIGLSYKIETIVKNSDLYREHREKRGMK